MRSLKVLDRAFKLAELTYTATRAFPSDEKFGLVSQMRRAAVSVGSNVAEGCGRSSERQFYNFLQIAAGSASELEFQARLSIRLKLGSADELQLLIRAILEERKMLGALCSRLRCAPEERGTKCRCGLKSEARSADAG